jgi:NADPH-dependent curcumin reductase CurA
MGLVPTPGRITQGEIWFTAVGKSAVDLLQVNEAERRSYRGGEIAMIFQEPMSALNPFYDIGFQLTEAIFLHQKLSSQDARRKAIAPVAMVAKYPEKLSPQEGTAIWMQYITAYGALVEYGQVKSGDFVLISAASSSVGSAAIQITKAAGATAIATTRGASKKQTLLDNGADHVVVSNEEDLPNRVMEITKGQGANLIFDPVAGSFIETLDTEIVYKLN